MAESERHIERAEKLLDKGRPEQALAELRAALVEQPDDDELLRRAADLCLSIGQPLHAAELLRRLFAILVDKRRLNEAAVVFRKQQRLRSIDTEVLLRYAELSVNTSRRESADAYRVACEELQRRGEARQALECLVRLAELEPKPEELREQVRLAEALHERELAARALVRLAVLREQQGESGGAEYARAFQNHPANMAARLGYGRALIAQSRPEEAIELLAPLATYPSSPEEAREPYARALLAVGRVEEAEPFAWSMYERDPKSNLEMLHYVIFGLLQLERVDKALGLARRLEDFHRRAGRRNDFMRDMARLAEGPRTPIRFIEYLAELYNSASREQEYAEVLSRLFELYIGEGNYAKAFDALDRAVDLDSYEAGHRLRLERLAGHAPEERLVAMAKRLGVEMPEPQVESAGGAEAVLSFEPPAPFEDLVLQGEIFLQYGMRDKALEKIEIIKQFYSAEVERDARVRELFLAAGLEAPEPPVEAVERNRAAEAVSRAAEVSRLIMRQSEPRAVLVTAVNQIGARWQYSRCVAALAAPGKPPSLVVEYCAPDAPSSERRAMVRLLALCQRLISREPIFRAADVQLAEALAPIRPELEALKIHSLAVLALVNDEQPIGMLLVEQCGVRRRWSGEDVEVLRSLADQTALAVHGARLRSLVSSLGVAEEATGLLKRSAYLDAVLAELSRQRLGGTTRGTLALLQLSSLTSETQTGQSAIELVRCLRKEAPEDAMAFRYDTDIVALLLPHMDAVEAKALVRQLRELLDTIGVTVTAGLAQAPSLEGMDNEDAVTEWVNRADRALHAASATAASLAVLPPRA